MRQRQKRSSSDLDTKSEHIIPTKKNSSSTSISSKKDSLSVSSHESSRARFQGSIGSATSSTRNNRCSRS